MIHVLAQQPLVQEKILRYRRYVLTRLPTARCLLLWCTLLPFCHLHLHTYTWTCTS